MTKWQWLSDLMAEKNISQTELGKIIDWPASRISELLADKRDIPARKLENFANFFGLDFKDLLAYNENRTNKIPIANKNICCANIVSIDVLDVSACCGNGIENFEENVIGQQMMTLPALREFTAAAPENIKIIKAIGDSMVPTIYPGDVVWVDISFKEPASDGLYLLGVGKELMIKRIQINPFDNSATIKADNPQYETFQKGNYQEIKVVGKIIYHMKKVG